MINPITSIADLLFKAKTQEPYRQLVILTANYIFSIVEPASIDTYEKSLAALDKYTQGITDCSHIVNSINYLRNQIPDPDDSKFNNLFVVKERQPRQTNDVSPSFNGEYMTISNNNIYLRASQEYERWRNRTYGDYTITSCQWGQTIRHNDEA